MDNKLQLLATNSAQGVEEFKTEVVFVAQLQHRNLVQLFGLCMRGNEKLLVYEFVLNSSLDKVLRNPDTEELLQWDTRYKVILGIMKGLLYLHEDSRMKIIHRDLKSSNILLDKNMEPKISDFGLARLVGADEVETHRIVGTYGYMAPEYAMHDDYSVKSDVYAFVVIVFEVLSDHKVTSTTSSFDQESMLERAWTLWNRNEAPYFADCKFGGQFSAEEMLLCYHIGLLCVQEDPRKRPTLSFIESALSGSHIDLPRLETPHMFASYSCINPDYLTK